MWRAKGRDDVASTNRSAAAPQMKAAIVGISGPELLATEAALFRAHPPAGVILFARNIQDRPQLATLIAALRRVLPRDAVFMVDQEGGRVARLRPPHWRAHPPAATLGSVRRAWLSGALIGLDCADAGFNTVAAPVLDLRIQGAHDVIGDRALAEEPGRIARLGRAFADGMLAAGVADRQACTRPRQGASRQPPGAADRRSEPSRRRPVAVRR